MTITRFMAILTGAIALQGLLFGLYYRDLLYLRKPVAAIVTGDRDAFAANANNALERPGVTRAHLDTIAEAAQRLDRLDLEVRALEERSEKDPSDRSVRLRLADALRRAGELQRAERIYLDLIDAKGVTP